MAEPAVPGPAVFRAVSMPGKKPRGEWRIAAIEIGTRSTCALNLNDPVVAEHHCTFRAVGDTFVVEDLGSVTGTWHNGVAVTGPVPLESGDQVVIGVTRLTVEVKREGDLPALDIVVEEASFHYKRPKPGEFHTDADEWVRSEVRFGKIPAVRGAAWICGLLAVGLCIWLFTTGSGERMLQPGPLNAGHVAHATCADCHAGSPTAGVTSCVACHQDMGRRHPFYTLAPDHDAVLAQSVGRPAAGCLICHPDQHAGLTKAEAKKLAHERVQLDFVQSDPASGVCRECHAGGLGSKEETLARITAMVERPEFEAQQSTTAAQAHAYRFEEFSHKAHASDPKIGCTTCHDTAEATRTAGGAGFPRPDFALCAACHVDWEGGADVVVREELPGLDRESLRELRARLGSKGKVSKMSWHGRGKRCLDCHASQDGEHVEKALATMTRQIVANTYGIVRMGHVEHATRVGAKADCRQCHGDLESLKAGTQEIQGTFLHGGHMETLWPKESDTKKVSATVCLTCHAGQDKSTSLAETLDVDLGGACKDCHSGPARPDSAKAVTRHPGARTTKQVRKFSHALHSGTDHACFDCHAFGKADDGDPRAVPALLPGVEDCTKCHQGHERIAGGACTLCHKGPFEAGHTRADWPGFQFPHFSGNAADGHASYVLAEGVHAQQGCAECHDVEEGAVRKVAEATRIRDVPAPDVRGWLCMDCHANKRGWFHWMLPDRPK